MASQCRRANTMNRWELLDKKLQVFSHFVILAKESELCPFYSWDTKAERMIKLNASM